MEYCESGKCKRLRKTGSRHLKHKIESNHFATELISLFVFFLTLTIMTPFLTHDANQISFLNSSWLAIAMTIVSIRYAYYLYKQQKKDGEWSRYIQHATTYFTEKDWLNARLYFDKSLEVFPDNIASLNNAGVCLTNLEKYVEAIPYYERILEIEPNNLTALNNKGWSLQEIYQLDNAKGCYEKALEIDPNRIDSLNNFGVLYLEHLCYYDKAIEYFDKISQIDPDDVLCYVNKARVFISKQEYAQALQYCNIALEKDPKDIEALNQKSVALFNLKQYEEVVSTGKLILELKPLHTRQNPGKLFQVTTLFNMAVSLANQKKFSEALSLIDQQLVVSPSDSLALRYKGDFLTELKDYKNALEDYEESLRLNPFQPQVLNNKAILLWELGKQIQAILTLNEGIRIKSSFSALWYNKAGFLSKEPENSDIVNEYHNTILSNPSLNFEDRIYQGRSMIVLRKYAEAVTHFDKLLIEDPKNIDVLSKKAEALVSDNKHSDAVEVFNRILEIKPDKVDILGKKGFSLYKAGKFNEALFTFNKILQQDPKNFDALMNKGIMLVEKGEIERAIKSCYDPLLDSEPGNYHALYGKGSALGKLRKFNEALSCYDSALEIKDDDVNVWLDKGGLLFELGRFKEAIDFLSKGFQKFSHEVKLMNGLSYNYARLNDYQNAWEWWFRYLQETAIGRGEIDKIIFRIRRFGPSSLRLRKIGDLLEIGY